MAVGRPLYSTEGYGMSGHRRSLSKQLDTPPGPETTEEERQFIDNLLARKEECEQEITDLNNIQSLSVSDHELKKSKVAEAKKELEKVELQICQARGDYLEIEESPACANSCQPANAVQIRQGFRVLRDEDENEKWWKSRLSDPGRYGLLECRHGGGKKGRGARTLWWPHQIAGWLVDRNNKGLDGLSSPAAGAALRKFPDCADLADLLSPPDE